MKKITAIILALAIGMSLAACSTSGSTQDTQPSPSQQAGNMTTSSTPQENTEPTNTTQPTEPQQSMCYWCGEVPVGDFETFCANCRCLKCDQKRKSGGDYLYCADHNCNESWCEYPAFEDSQYCSEHKCSKPNCDNRRWNGSEYCAHHK